MRNIIYLIIGFVVAFVFKEKIIQMLNKNNENMETIEPIEEENKK